MSIVPSYLVIGKTPLNESARMIDPSGPHSLRGSIEIYQVKNSGGNFYSRSTKANKEPNVTSWTLKSDPSETNFKVSGFFRAAIYLAGCYCFLSFYFSFFSLVKD